MGNTQSLQTVKEGVQKRDKLYMVCNKKQAIMLIQFM